MPGSAFDAAVGALNALPSRPSRPPSCHPAADHPGALEYDMPSLETVVETAPRRLDEALHP